MDRLTMLQAFVRVVELETFSAVANELRVTQSTVSKWMAALEQDLGVRLVDRTTRSLRVTDEGRRFYRRARALLADYESAVAEVGEPVDGLRGAIRLSAPVVFGRRYVAPLVTEFVLRHEHLELELVLSDRYVRLVEDGFDIAVRVGVPVDSSLRSHALGGGRRRLVAAPSYVERHGMPRTPRDLEQHQCLVHSPQRARALWWFERGKRRHHVKVAGRVASNHSEATLQLATAGLGIALLAAWLVDESVASGRLVTLLDGYAPPLAPVHALTPPGRLVVPRVQALIECLQRGLVPALNAS